MDIDCVVPSRSRIGEGAVWDHRAQVLWWVDIPAGLIHCYDPSSGQNTTIDYGEPVGCLAVRENGGLVLATKSGFWFYDPESGAREAIGDPETDLEYNRFNDGTTDPAGRFWAGTMKDGGEPEALGRFYRLDPELTITPWKGDIYTTNGLAFSPDGSVMYFSDSNARVRTIWKCAYDLETGTPGEPEVFFDTHQVPGRPDGGTVDADGCYWQAGIEGWQLYRLTPQGKIDMTIDLPIEKPSKPMFGGAGLDTLFVTSLGIGLSTDRPQPEAGSLFAITGLGITGMEQARFAG